MFFKCVTGMCFTRVSCSKSIDIFQNIFWKSFFSLQNSIAHKTTKLDFHKFLAHFYFENICDN